MSSKIRLVSQDNKEVFLSAKGPDSATIILPGEETFEFASRNEIEETISQELIGSTRFIVLNKPVITSPTNNASLHTGGITVENNFNLGNKFGHIKVIYQIADSVDFNNIVAEIEKETTSTSASGTNQNLPGILRVTQEELINKGILGSTSEVINRYFLRVKIFFESSCSYWSDTVRFTYASNAYRAPVIEEITFNTDPLLLEQSIEKYTGVMTIKTTGYFVERGTLPQPERVIITLSKNGRSKSYSVKYNNKHIQFLPEFTDSLSKVTSNENFKVVPGEEYNISIKYECIDGSNLRVESPVSTGTSTFRYPVPRIIIGNLQIVQNAENILTAPTVGVDGIYIDYDFANVKSNGTPYTDSENHTLDTRLIKVSFKVYNSAEMLFVSREVGMPLWSFTSNNQDTNAYTGCLITLNDGRFSISQTYKLEATVSLEGNTSGLGLATTVKSKSFQIKGNTITVPMDNLNTIIATYPPGAPKQFGYFGEIVGSYTPSASKPNTLMPNVKFKGYFLRDVPYNRHDEVVYNNELYLCIRDTISSGANPSETPENFTKVTFENFNTLYKSGLPSYTWLAREIGLPINMPYSKTTTGEVVADDACGRVINDTEGWIKVHNFAKQILYIAKKPIASNISYRELKRRFLTGAYTRTVRIGLNYYSVRLLEVSPSDVIDEELMTTENIKNPSNLQNEKELYSSIFRKLFTYQMLDLGLTKDTNYTYGNKSKIRTYEILDEYGSKDIITEETEINTTDYDANGGMYYYRPVLELIRENNLPFRKSKDLPGAISQNDTKGAWLEYDRWTDTGYYGTVSANMLFTPSELKSLFNLPDLNNVPKDVRYHKFYWHGLAIYIPNKPIGIVPKPELNELLTSGHVFGTDTNKYILAHDTKWIMSLPNFSPNYYITYGRRPGDNQSNINYVDYGSIIFDLIYRLVDNPGYSKTNYPNLKKFELATGLNTEFDEVKGFITKDLVIGKFNQPWLNINSVEDAIPYVDFARGSSVFRPIIYGPTSFEDRADYEKYSAFWPMIITEVADKKLDYHYPTASTASPTYESSSIRVKRYKVKPVEVTREEIVNEPITKEVEVKYMVEKKVETGNYVFKTDFPRQVNDTFGLVVFYAKKTDACYFTTPLYRPDSLNVVNFLNGLGIKFSNRFPTIDTYMLQSVITNGTTAKITADPIIINKFFRESRDVKTYLKNLVRPGLRIGTLRNFASNIVNTSTDRLKPYGMMYGKVSSSYLYYAVPEWYNLFETPDPNGGKMNIDPMITVDQVGGLDNTWVKLPDINNDMVTVPLLNTYLSYEDYSVEGKKDLIDVIIPYIINREYSNVTVDTVESIKEEIKNNYIFGVIGANLDTLCVLQDNGIVYGDAITPSFIQTPASHRMTPYFNTTSEVLDIFNPEKDYVIEYVEETRIDTIQVDNFVKKTYTEIVYEEYIEEVTVNVPVIKYT